MPNALYRKYRPIDFSSVVGQAHITRVLTNQIKSGKIGHAYLFCGSRGVGKTTLARIFSRAVNCVDADSTKFPCYTCPVCKGLAQENSLDIIEIDAASNNGVDDARELRERIKYPPVTGKYKVYIIDEVHSLSQSAFNALLKTLEEPPSHAILILATTEPQKLPATILSRCLRLDFRLLSLAEIKNLLAEIFRKERKAVEEGALDIIAAAANGSVRDALSLADVAAGLDSGVLTAAQTAAILGQGDEAVLELLDKIKASDTSGAFIIINRLINEGKSAAAVVTQLSILCRDLLTALVAPSILSVSHDKKERLILTSAQYSINRLTALLNLFLEAESTLRYAASPRIALESAVLRAIKMVSHDLSALYERILRLEEALKTVFKGGVYTETQDVNNNAGGLGVRADFQPNPPQPSQNIPTASSKLNPAQLWGRIITYFRKNASVTFFQLIGRHDPSQIFISGDILTIYASREDYLAFCGDEFLALLKNAILSQGLDYKIVIEKNTKDIDFEKEITSLRAEFGAGKISVKSDKK